MKFADAYAQLDELYGDATGRFMVHRWMHTDNQEIYHLIWPSSWAWFRIYSDQVTAAVFYDLLRLVRRSPGACPYIRNYPDYWHIETPDSFFDYLRDHLTTKGKFKKCI